MVRLISRVSKGSLMDQIYIPKNRSGFGIGSYVVIEPLEMKPEEDINLYYYNVKDLEPLKVNIIREIFRLINEKIENENIIISGSFLEKGYRFNDIDVILITNESCGKKIIEDISESIGVNIHLIALNNNALLEGLSTDPLYRVMLSRCVTVKRMIYNIKSEIKYKLLDIHLLKSKNLAANFDILTGPEKYDMTRNMVAINLFIEGKEVGINNINNEVNKIFGDNTVEKLKDNVTYKKDFINKYKRIYKTIEQKILRGIAHDSKQKQAD